MKAIDDKMMSIIQDRIYLLAMNPEVQKKMLELNDKEKAFELVAKYAIATLYGKK